MSNKFRRALAFAAGFALTASALISAPGLTAEAGESGVSYSQTIEFEDQCRYEQNGRNRTDSSMFSGYSGSGYVYLEEGWSEVQFTVPSDGTYTITLVSNADSYKENWLYLDDSGAGTLQTEGYQWNRHTADYYLTAGTHKFGVSSSWGYTALDYVTISSDGSSVPDPDPSEPTQPVDPDPSEPETPDPQEPANPDPQEPADAYTETLEFEEQQLYEQNGRNRTDSSMFSGYSGNGYVYLEEGWSEVQFTVPSDGAYTITLVSNADSYKENWLYLDDSGAGTLQTQGSRWNNYTADYYLTAGTHKFGVSSSWGYTALDCVIVASTEASSGSGSDSGQDTPDPTMPPAEGGMYISGGKLYDASGQEFIMRGVNIAHAWYADYTETSINAIADLGANCVRVVLADGTQWTKTTYQEVETIIKWCENRGLVCILEVHDHTGYDDVSRLNIAVDYWTSMASLLNAHKDYVIVNIANEWLGTWNMGSTWTSGYQAAIRALRNAGIENVLMVDAAGYGQETSTCIDNCQSVLSADPDGNTMFSFHMYSVAGANAQTVKSNIDAMLSKGVSFCIGEFGNYQNGGDVDEATIMQYCTEKGIGYAAWSWKGNSGSGNETLDLSNDWEGNSLTEWGNYVFNASGTGIRDTSRLAY